MEDSPARPHSKLGCHTLSQSRGTSRGVTLLPWSAEWVSNCEQVNAHHWSHVSRTPISFLPNSWNFCSALPCVQDSQFVLTKFVEFLQCLPVSRGLPVRFCQICGISVVCSGGGRYDAACRHHGTGFDPLEVSVTVNFGRKWAKYPSSAGRRAPFWPENGTFWTFDDDTRRHTSGFGV